MAKPQKKCHSKTSSKYGRLFLSFKKMQINKIFGSLSQNIDISYFLRMLRYWGKKFEIINRQKSKNKSVAERSLHINITLFHMLYSHHPVFKKYHYWISKPFHHIDLFTTKNQMLPLPSLFGYVLIILWYVDVNGRCGQWFQLSGSTWALRFQAL